MYMAFLLDLERDFWVFRKEDEASGEKSTSSGDFERSPKGFGKMSWETVDYRGSDATFRVAFPKNASAAAAMSCPECMDSPTYQSKRGERESRRSGTSLRDPLCSRAMRESRGRRKRMQACW